MIGDYIIKIMLFVICCVVPIISFGICAWVEEIKKAHDRDITIK